MSTVVDQLPKNLCFTACRPAEDEVVEIQQSISFLECLKEIEAIYAVKKRSYRFQKRNKKETVSTPATRKKLVDLDTYRGIFHRGINCCKKVCTEKFSEERLSDFLAARNYIHGCDSQVDSRVYLSNVISFDEGKSLFKLF